MVNYKPVPTTLTAEKLAKVLIEEVIKYHDLTDSIVTDRGSPFTSKFWSSLSYYLNVKGRLSTSFHPQTDKQTERQNSIIETDLQAYCQLEQDDWVRWLLIVEFAYNNSPQASNIMSFFEVFLAYHPRITY